MKGTTAISVIVFVLLLSGCAVQKARQAAVKANATESNVCLEAFNLREKACTDACASIPDKAKMTECTRNTPACVFIAPCVAYGLSKDSAKKTYFEQACIRRVTKPRKKPPARMRTLSMC